MQLHRYDFWYCDESVVRVDTFLHGKCRHQMRAVQWKHAKKSCLPTDTSGYCNFKSCLSTFTSPCICVVVWMVYKSPFISNTCDCDYRFCDAHSDICIHTEKMAGVLVCSISLALCFWLQVYFMFFLSSVLIQCLLFVTTYNKEYKAYLPIFYRRLSTKNGQMY